MRDGERISLWLLLIVNLCKLLPYNCDTTYLTSQANNEKILSRSQDDICTFLFINAIQIRITKIEMENCMIMHVPSYYACSHQDGKIRTTQG